MREANPGMVRINGQPVPDVDDSEFTLEDIVQLRIPLVSQKYETTITITPNSFNADGIPEFTVATKPVD